MKKILSLILSAVMALSLLSVPVWADEETGLTAEATSNTNDQNYSVYYASTVKSYLVDTDEGLMRVEYTGSTDDGVVVEYYDSNYQITSQKYISFELSIFGGFYEGEDAYYLVFGQNNSDEDDSVEVVRVVKYSKDWERLGAASLYGANTTIPFRSGSLRMAECNGYLYIRTSHQMYTSTDGLKHQANLMIEVQESDMTISDSYYSVMNNSVGYVSHSFNQFILVDDDSNLVALDHGDAYPRAAIISKYVKQAGNSTFSGRTSYVNVFSFKGTTGTNSTGASLGGFEYSSTSYLVAGNSVTQDDDWSSHTARNVFVTVTSRSDFSADGTEIKWITEYDTDGSISASTPQLVKLDTDRFLLLWTTTEYDDSSVAASKQVKLHYVYLDGDGNMTSDIYTTDGQLSDCKPVVVDGAAVWYVTGDSSGISSTAETTPVFYKITSDGTVTITVTGNSSGSDGSGGSSSDSGNTGSDDSGSTGDTGSGDTLMVRRGTTMYFNYILKGGNADFSISAGEATDQVLVGDWDGDGIDTICLRRGNYCYFIDDITTMHVYLTVTYGRSGDAVLVGDWDGDGCDSLAMRRNGNYYYFCNDITNPDGDTWSATYGRVNDEVYVGDWENSGYDSLAVRRNGNYYFFSLSKVTDPNGDVWVTTFGRAGDDVLVGDWDANGTDTLAMRRNGNTYYISNSIAEPDSGVDTFTFGRAGDEVYAGKWK